MSQEANDLAMFAGIKKKKKTAKPAFDDTPSVAPASDAAPTSIPPATNDTPAADEKPIVDSQGEVDAVAPTQTDADLTLKDGEEPFGGELKKKKKKKTFNIEELDDKPTSAPLARTDALGNTSIDPSSDPSSTTPAGTGTTADGEAIPKKKKKAKKNLDLEGFEAELAASGGAEAAEPEKVVQGTAATQVPVVKRDEDDDEDGDGIGGGAGGEDDEVEGAEGVFAEDEGGEEVKETSKALQAAQKEAWNEPGQRDRDYEYIELLGRFYSILYDANPALSNAGGKRRLALPPPSMHRDGNKRSVFANIADIAKKLHRQPEHVIQFLFAELGTTGSVDGSARLVIKGRFQGKQIENVLRRYTVEYVTCKTCKSNNTILLKDNRIYFVECEDCRSRRSVSAIKTGFQAQTGKRSRKAAA